MALEVLEHHAGVVRSPGAEDKRLARLLTGLRPALAELLHRAEALVASRPATAATS